MVVSERIKIRPITCDDLPQIIPIHSDPLVNQYLPYETWQSDADATAWFKRIKRLSAEEIVDQFVIELLEDNQIIGTCILINHDRQKHFAEIGYVLRRKYWDKGFMFEAMTVFIAFLKNELEIRSIQATTEIDNIASIKLLEKLKFKSTAHYAGHLKEMTISFLLS